VGDGDGDGDGGGGCGIGEIIIVHVVSSDGPQWQIDSASQEFASVKSPDCSQWASPFPPMEE
jgi:hypothetical protein